MKKIIATTIIAITFTGIAQAGIFDKLKSAVSGTDKTAVTDIVTDAVSALSPEEAVKKLIDKCATPTTDGICECVANATLGNLTQDQWKILNHYIFDTRATVSTTSFLLENPWLVTKLFTPYVKCSGK